MTRDEETKLDEAIDSDGNDNLLQWFQDHPHIRWRSGGFVPTDGRSLRLTEKANQLIRDGRLAEVFEDGLFRHVVVQPGPNHG